tara:strand:- start:1721 stop:2968 length:1248 start_codon:yes stop_codon:yes gene_type:complete
MAQKIEQLKAADLIPYAANTRTHDEKQVAQVAASIKEFGFTNPILVDSDNGIIAGHGRLLAAQKLGLEVVPCLRLGHLTDAQRRAYIIADNKLALNAGWDEDALATEIERLLEDGFDLDLTGFGEDEISDFLDQGEKDGLTDDDDVPDASDDLVTINGDVWKMGKHRLLCGDSTSTDDLLKLCEGQLVDMWLTDPPYNVAYEGKTADALTIQNDQMEDGSFRDFLRASYSAADSVMKAGAVFYIWHADSEGYNFRGAAHDVNWKVRQCLIWKKNSLVMGRQDYHWIHEPCLYGWKEGAGHLWASDRTQTTVLEFQRPSRSTEHPTMKPVELFSYQMLNNTKGDDLVLDSFAGSGTTAIVCEKHNRQARIVELDPKYCDVIVRRWQEFTGSEAVNEATGLTFEKTEAKMKGNPVNG